MQIDLSGVRVLIGMPVYGRIPPATAMSLARTLHRCGASGIDCDAVMEVAGIVEIARDGILDAFLKSTADKLVWIDSDMVWAPDDFLRLVGLSTVRDVVCATYPTKTDPPRYALDLKLPVESDEFGLMEIRGAGLGFAAMDRKVCEAVARDAPLIDDSMLGRPVASVFRIDVVNGRRRSEDMAFFADIGARGFQVWLDPTINLGHIGDRQWTGHPMDAFSPA